MAGAGEGVDVEVDPVERVEHECDDVDASGCVNGGVDGLGVVEEDVHEVEELD